MIGSSGERRVRVILVGIPRLLREIITGAVAVQPDMRIVEDLPAWNARTQAPEGPVADVVLVGLSRDAATEECGPLARRWPNATVLGIAPSGRRTVLCELAVRTIELGELSPDALMEEIRRCAGG